VIACSVPFILVGLGTKWIRVDYHDKLVGPRVAYLADGSHPGWAGILGGTREIHRAIMGHGPGGGRPITDGELSGLESRRGRRRLLGWATHVVVVIAAVTAGSAFGSTIVGSAPVEGPVPIARPADPGRLYVGTEVGKDGRPTDTYCWAPDERLAQFVVLTNPGLLPMTIYGDSPYMIDGWSWQHDGFTQMDLAPYRQSAPADAPATGRLPTDPRTAPVLPPTTLDPGGSVEVWVRYTTNSAKPDSDWPITRPSPILVKYKVLWNTHVGMVEPLEAIAITGPCPAAP
jgi:hypothetical protein